MADEFKPMFKKNKFNIGDRVRCAVSGFTVTKDKVYEVMATSGPTAIGVKDDAGVITFFGNRYFEKVEEKTDMAELEWETNFQVGDIVQCVDDYLGLAIGEYYKVDKVYTDINDNTVLDITSTSDGLARGNGWSASRFKKVIMTKFNIGDRVRCINRNGTLSENTEYTVTDINFDKNLKETYLTVQDDTGRKHHGYYPQRFELVRNSLNEFKKRVWEAAQSAKKKHGWCEEVDKILEELDVENPNPTITYIVSIPVEVDGPAGIKNAQDLFTPSVTITAVQKTLKETAKPGIKFVYPKTLYNWKVEVEEAQ